MAVRIPELGIPDRPQEAEPHIRVGVGALHSTEVVGHVQAPWPAG